MLEQPEVVQRDGNVVVIRLWVGLERSKQPLVLGASLVHTTSRLEIICDAIRQLAPRSPR